MESRLLENSEHKTLPFPLIHDDTFQEPKITEDAKLPKWIQIEQTL